MIDLTVSEFRQLLSAVDLRAPLGPRDYLMLVFGYNTGLRVSELEGLSIHDVALDGEPRATLYVSPALAKRHRGRTVPLNSLAQTAVRKLLNFNRTRGFSIENNAPLFVTKNHTRLAVRSIQFIVSGLADKAGLAFKITPHVLRHGFASNIAENTGNLRIVQALLGHKELNTAQIYTHPRRHELARAVETLVEGGH